MKKIIAVICATLLSGCYSVRIATPKNESLALAPVNAICSEWDGVKNWYALWGLIPLNKRATTQLLAEKNGPVQLETKHTFVDMLGSFVIGFFTSITMNTTQIRSCSSK